MQTYCPDKSKRKKALKSIIKINIKQSKGFVKFCYGATWFLRILAVVLGIANILYVIFMSDYMVDILFLIITFGFPYAFSYLPATVYIISASGEYRFRKQELERMKFYIVFMMIVLDYQILFLHFMLFLKISINVIMMKKQMFLHYMERL